VRQARQQLLSGVVGTNGGALPLRHELFMCEVLPRKRPVLEVGRDKMFFLIFVPPATNGF